MFLELNCIYLYFLFISIIIFHIDNGLCYLDHMLFTTIQILLQVKSCLFHVHCSWTNLFIFFSLHLFGEYPMSIGIGRLEGGTFSFFFHFFIFYFAPMWWISGIVVCRLFRRQHPFLFSSWSLSYHHDFETTYEKCLEYHCAVTNFIDAKKCCTVQFFYGNQIWLNDCVHCYLENSNFLAFYKTYGCYILYFITFCTLSLSEILQNYTH